MSSSFNPRTGKPKQTNKFYAVTRSPLLEKPTIFSSWQVARVHVVVTGQDASHKSFSTLPQAREHMKKNGVVDFATVLGPTREIVASVPGITYYAVANGHNPGIKEIYSGVGGSKNDVDRYRHCCHQGFPTRKQAEEFMNEWKEQYTKVAARKIRQELDEGIRLPVTAKGVSLFPSLQSAAASAREAELEAPEANFARILTIKYL